MTFEGTGILLTPRDIELAAQMLGTSPDVIRAVIEVECAGRGFGPHNRPTILFEPHVFYRQLKIPEERGRAVIAKLAAARWREIPYPRTQQQRYAQLTAACEINESAALRSASWGLGQIMGFNYLLCGHGTVQALVESAKQSEGAQLMDMCRFIRARKLDDELRLQDWSAFAAGYNGPLYKRNRYDERLEAAFVKHSDVRHA